jgi:DNA-binding transcriptional LysR family regulator
MSGDFRMTAVGESITPVGPLRVTNADALVLTILAGLAIAELSDFIAGDYLPDGRMIPLLRDRSLPKGALFRDADGA